MPRITFTRSGLSSTKRTSSSTKCSALCLAVSEASTHWGSVLEGLQARGLRAPKLVISDGHKGLTKALEKWPGCRLQRCTEHKRANLLQHCPAHARRELRRDYNRIVYAKNGIDARKAYDELVAKWTPLAPAVVRSLEEAGNQLLTFYEFPRAMWKSIRTTNALENLNREFRRRTKTQARRVRKCERSRKLESWRRSRDSRRPADAALALR